MSKWATILLRIEVLICFGPNFVYLPTGIVMIPHQLRLAIGEEVADAWIPITYYAGVVCLLIGVWNVWKWIRLRECRLPPLATTSMLFIGLCAVSMGPAGTFALARFEDIGITVPLIFFGLPLLGVIHLGYLAREYLFGMRG